MEADILSVAPNFVPFTQSIDFPLILGQIYYGRGMSVEIKLAYSQKELPKGCGQNKIATCWKCLSMERGSCPCWIHQTFCRWKAKMTCKCMVRSVHLYFCHMHYVLTTLLHSTVLSAADPWSTSSWELTTSSCRNIISGREEKSKTIHVTFQ